MNLADFRIAVEQRNRFFRRLNELANTESFSRAFDKVDDKTRKCWFDCGDIWRIKNEVRQLLYGELELMSLSQLKEMSRQKGILLWHIKSKNELVAELDVLNNPRTS